MIYVSTYLLVAALAMSIFGPWLGFIAGRWSRDE